MCGENRAYGVRKAGSLAKLLYHTIYMPELFLILVYKYIEMCIRRKDYRCEIQFEHTKNYE